MEMGNKISFSRLFGELRLFGTFFGYLYFHSTRETIRGFQVFPETFLLGRNHNL